MLTKVRPHCEGGLNRAREIIASAPDHDANNEIGADPTAQRGTVTPASLTANTQNRHWGRDSGDGYKKEGGRRDKQQKLLKLTHTLPLLDLSLSLLLMRLPNIYIPKKAFTMDETPNQSLSFIPHAAGVAQSRSHAWFASQSLGIKAGVEKACWCFTGILSERGNDGKRRKQSYLRYIYTIGCKSFLMGSRVQRRGRDYHGRSESAVTCICPGLALWTPPSCTLAWRAREWSQMRRFGPRWGWQNKTGGGIGVAKTTQVADLTYPCHCVERPLIH